MQLNYCKPKRAFSLVKTTQELERDVLLMGKDKDAFAIKQ